MTDAITEAMRALAREINSPRKFGRQERIRTAADHYFRLLDETRKPGPWKRFKTWMKRSVASKVARSTLSAGVCSHER